MKTEKGITLAILAIYVVFFSVLISLLAALSSYIYNNIGYVNDNSVDVSEFNKFNRYFIEDVKTNTQAEVKETTNSEGKNIVQITFEDGDTYRYVAEEKSMYKNRQKIAKDIQNFEAEQLTNTEYNKKYINVNIVIGANDEANYEKEIEYVLKYW